MEKEMIEFPLKWVIILAGAFLALAVGFMVILIYMLYQRSANKNGVSNLPAPQIGAGLLARLDERIFSRRSVEPETIVAPPMQGEEGQKWLLLYRQPETEQLTLSLPGKEIVLEKNTLTDDELMQVKTMALGLEHWLGLTLSKPVEKPVTPIVPLPDASNRISGSSFVNQTPGVETTKSNPLTRSIFSRREVEEIKPMVSIAVQINVVLQDILDRENYSGPDFHLTDNANGDLVIVMGTEKYIGVDAVPDSQVAALIKRAADRWTEQQLRRG
jgi:hypothetical protein